MAEHHPTLDLDNIPRHIAIIMDGNGRWAKSKGLPRSAGHKAGAETVRNIVESCIELGVKHLTLYAFSSENWNRPPSEVDALMGLLEKFLKQKTKEMQKRDVKLNAIGRTAMLPPSTQKALAEAIETTKDNKTMTMTLALSYGSREEIVDAVKSIAAQVKNGERDIEDINNEAISDSLYTADIPDPDLLIRTSGEQRLSNFLLWQLSYAEFYISDKNWPTFTDSDLKQAILCFQKRHRRYGAL